PPGCRARRMRQGHRPTQRRAAIRQEIASAINARKAGTSRYDVPARFQRAERAVKAVRSGSFVPSPDAVLPLSLGSYGGTSGNKDGVARYTYQRHGNHIELHPRFLCPPCGRAPNQLKSVKSKPIL